MATYSNTAVRVEMAGLEGIRPRRMADGISGQILHFIFTVKWKPGDRLPSESRSAVRQHPWPRGAFSGQSTDEMGILLGYYCQPGGQAEQQLRGDGLLEILPEITDSF